MKHGGWRRCLTSTRFTGDAARTPTPLRPRGPRGCGHPLQSRASGCSRGPGALAGPWLSAGPAAPALLLPERAEAPASASWHQLTLLPSLCVPVLPRQLSVHLRDFHQRLSLAMSSVAQSRSSRPPVGFLVAVYLPAGPCAPQRESPPASRSRSCGATQLRPPADEVGTQEYPWVLVGRWASTTPSRVAGPGALGESWAGQAAQPHRALPAELAVLPLPVSPSHPGAIGGTRGTTVPKDGGHQKWLRSEDLVFMLDCGSRTSPWSVQTGGRTCPHLSS